MEGKWHDTRCSRIAGFSRSTSIIFRKRPTAYSIQVEVFEGTPINNTMLDNNLFIAFLLFWIM